MDFTLSWDLVLVGIFFILFAYNFLLGQNGTLKLILSIYIAILTADGLTNIIKEFIVTPSPGMTSLFQGHEIGIYTSIRIFLFFIAIIVFVVKGGFHIKIEEHDHWLARIIIHGVFSAFAVILLLSTILIYLSGQSFIGGITDPANISLYDTSFLTQILVDYYQIWFTTPAIVFLVTSFVLPINED